MKKTLHVGLDVGSTTVKIVVMNDKLENLYTSYTRHHSDTKNTIYEVLKKLIKDFPNSTYTMSLTGSGALEISKVLGIPFIQEVIACKRAVEKYIPQTDVVIELGGEDAKIIYFDKFIEQRMNGTCAGGTGAFLDQMASLLNTDTQGLNELSKGHEIIYPIASRCGVFAKTDVQPLINEGARKEDIATSIFQAVVNQTISGLACGRPIKGKVAFLGGPLNYLPELRKRFIETLKLKDDEVIVPEEAHLLVAKGAALASFDTEEITTRGLKEKLEEFKDAKYTETKPLEPLFKNEQEYDEFKKRHEKDKVRRGKLEDTKGDIFVGIDAGSTTTKLVAIDKDGALLKLGIKSDAFGEYSSNMLMTSNQLLRIINYKEENWPSDSPLEFEILVTGNVSYGGYEMANYTSKIGIEEIPTNDNVCSANGKINGIYYKSLFDASLYRKMQQEAQLCYEEKGGSEDPSGEISIDSMKLLMNCLAEAAYNNKDNIKIEKWYWTIDTTQLNVCKN